MKQFTSKENNSQENRRNRQRYPNPGPPANVESQRDFVLRILKEAASSGVNKDDFLQGRGRCNGRRVTQPQARLHELTKMGYVFESKTLPGDAFTTLYLKSEPLIPQREPVQRAGWRSGGFQYGKNTRESNAPVAVPQAVQQVLGLLDSAVTTSRPQSDKTFVLSETGRMNW
jgi:hypothetical protein